MKPYVYKETSDWPRMEEPFEGPKGTGDYTSELVGNLRTKWHKTDEGPIERFDTVGAFRVFLVQTLPIEGLWNVHVNSMFKEAKQFIAENKDDKSSNYVVIEKYSDGDIAGVRANVYHSEATHCGTVYLLIIQDGPYLKPYVYKETSDWPRMEPFK